MEPTYFHSMYEHTEENENEVYPVDKQLRHRYLYGADPALLSTALLPGDMGYQKLPPVQDYMHYEQPFPAFNIWTPLSRNASPDTTSTTDTSNYAPLNEYNSPPPQWDGSLGSPDDFLLHTISFSTPEYVHEGIYPTKLPLQDRSLIDPRKIEFYPHESKPVLDDIELVDTVPSYEYENETTYVKQEATMHPLRDDSKAYPLARMCPALPVAEEVQPIAKGEDSDPDYTPTNPSPKRIRAKKSIASRYTSTSTTTRARKSSSAPTPLFTPHRVTKRISHLTSARSSRPSPNNTRTTGRPFPCPLAAYGCKSDFASKNEWKRHFSTQHLKLGFWRCDLCPPSVDPHDTSALYYNDFNRKDLFTQHLRRMHFARPGPSPTVTTADANADGSPAAALSPISLPPRQRTSYHSHYRATPCTTPVTDATLLEVHARCYIKLRDTPTRSACLFCDEVFGSWDERMEHVGRHMEKEKGVAGVRLEPGAWRVDEELEVWFEREGLIERVNLGEGGSGGWRIGDGRPRRGEGGEMEGDEE